MNREEIIQGITPIFRKVFEDSALIVSDSLTADQVENWTSLNHMEMISEIESHFGIKFKLKELTQIQNQNVGGFVDLIAQCLSKKM